MGAGVTASTELHFVADDFGLSAGVNAAVVRAHRSGALTGASLMMGQPGTEEAVALAREHPGLHIGWHLHLCDSHPLCGSEWPWGSSPVRAALAGCVSASARRRMRAEVLAQWEAFQAAGIPCRFVNTHHHLHLHPRVLDLLRTAVGPRPGAWFRGGAFRSFGPGEALMPRLTREVGTLGRHLGWDSGFLPCVDSVWGVDRLHRMQADEVRRVISGLPPGRHEFFFHPRNPAGDADLEALLALGCLRKVASSGPSGPTSGEH
ncbi:MAG: ChbG/HpnK family deacetylase [Verrucomicrobia bacterium]|nr:ChbG/HpnK family deacetylase [Verrucomicrobiota bacterium]